MSQMPPCGDGSCDRTARQGSLPGHRVGARLIAMPAARLGIVVDDPRALALGGKAARHGGNDAAIEIAGIGAGAYHRGLAEALRFVFVVPDFAAAVLHVVSNIDSRKPFLDRVDCRRKLGVLRDLLPDQGKGVGAHRFADLLERLQPGLLLEPLPGLRIPDSGIS